MNYADLQVTTHFSFLRGVSSPEELFSAAAMLGIKALGIVDRNSLAGMVRAHEAAKTTGVRLVVGCRVDLQCGTSLLLYPTDRPAYGRLCRLLSLGKSRAGKGRCHLDWPDVEAWQDGLLAVLLPDEAGERLQDELHRLKRIFGDRAHCGLTRRFLPEEVLRLRIVADAAGRWRVELPRRPARYGRDAAAPRPESDRTARIRALLPDRGIHRPLRPVKEHSLPGPGFRRKFSRVLRARRHLD